MLQSFSDRIRNSKWLGYTIVIAICIPFALWGVQSYVGGPSPQVAAEVNGEPIKEREVTQMVSQRRQQLRQRFGGELPGAFSDSMLRQQVLDQLITQELLVQVASESGFRVTDAMVAAAIRQQRPFQRDGEFDRQRYKSRLKRAGLSPQEYEGRIRRSRRAEQLRRGVSESAFALEGEANLAARLRREERRVTVLQRRREAVADDLSIAEEAVAAYYDEHQDAFRTPRRVRVSYIELNMDKLRQQIDIPQEKLRAQYEANKEQYRAAAERKASHILIRIPDDGGDQARKKAKRKAEQLAQRVRNGGDFDALARQYSDDSGSAERGGDLGYISRGSMAKPFEEALFGLDREGAVAGPVETSYGFHVIRLEDIRQPEPKPFEEVKDEIRRKLATQRAERLFYDRVELLKNEAYENPSSLEPAADATGLSIERSDWFSRSNGEGIAQHEAVRTAAFSKAVRQQGRNSDIIELGERRVVVLRVAEEKAPKVKPLEQVRDEVRAKLREQRVSERLKAWAQQTIERLRGPSSASLAEADDVTVEEPGWIQRQGGGRLDRAVTARAFELAPPRGGQRRFASVETSDGRAVLVVHESRLPSVDSETVQTARERLRSGLARAEVRAWIKALKEAAEIVRRDKPKSGANGGSG